MWITCAGRHAQNLRQFFQFVLALRGGALHHIALEIVTDN
jgi:hypothetical protein